MVRPGKWRKGVFYPAYIAVEDVGLKMKLHDADSYRNIEYNDNIFGFRELESMLCGKIIATGSARQVYECRLNPDYVVKREITYNTRQNTIEAEMWDYCKGFPEHSKWLAPIRFTSPNCMFIIQDRTEPLTNKDRPRRLPEFLDSDIKLENFGKLRGGIVCHDYGTLIAGVRRRGTKMVQASWYA